jgi:hypothetical protein
VLGWSAVCFKVNSLRKAQQVLPLLSRSVQSVRQTAAELSNFSSLPNSFKRDVWSALNTGLYFSLYQHLLEATLLLVRLPLCEIQDFCKRFCRRIYITNHTGYSSFAEIYQLHQYCCYNLKILSTVLEDHKTTTNFTK